MKYRYQLILLGSIENPIIKGIKDQIISEISDLKLPQGIINIIDRNNWKDEYVGNQPAFCIYLGNDNGFFEDLAIVEKLIKDGTMILPVYFNDFSKEIPEELKKQNGIKYDDNQQSRIANIVLQAFELLRSTRKVFISYKRSESTSVAIQMYEALESHHFDVFLDTHSIEKGEPFQEELWHRMTDCDVILLLNTPGFLESHCKEELAEAGSKQIGIVQLVWPNHKINAISHLSFPLNLESTDFVNTIYDDKDKSKLKNNKVEEIVQFVESVRARNLASRQDNLITEFMSIAKQCGRDITVQPERYLTEVISGKKIIYVPTIGIPQSFNCQAADIRYEYDKNPQNTRIRLIYDDLRIRDKWLKHLDWLNNNLKKDIFTLKKQEFKKWLETTK